MTCGPDFAAVFALAVITSGVQACVSKSLDSRIQACIPGDSIMTRGPDLAAVFGLAVITSGGQACVSESTDCHTQASVPCEGPWLPAYTGSLNSCASLMTLTCHTGLIRRRSQHDETSFVGRSLRGLTQQCSTRILIHAGCRMGCEFPESWPDMSRIASLKVKCLHSCACPGENSMMLGTSA